MNKIDDEILANVQKIQLKNGLAQSKKLNYIRYDYASNYFTLGTFTYTWAI